MTRLAALLFCAVLAACSTTRVTLLDAETPGGSAGAVAVIDPDTGAERGQLTQANTQARLSGAEVRPHPRKPHFEALLSVMPPPPQVFTLYFVEGTTQVAPQSVATLDQLRGIVTPTSDVQITGYTDTTGDAESNDKLSLARAVEVRAALVAEGLPVGNARVTGRGERDLRVPTGPGVSEAANRRAEVIIR